MTPAAGFFRGQSDGNFPDDTRFNLVVTFSGSLTCFYQSSPPFFSKVILIFLIREKEKERNIDVQEIHRSVGCLLHAPDWGPGPQPQHAPWLGIELATFCFAGRHSICWATPAGNVAPDFTHLTLRMAWSQSFRKINSIRKHSYCLIC